VVLVLRGARADLTLIDLPGIIQSDEDNPGNVGLVKDMVTGFIKRGRAIIVAAISCKDDINNQVGCLTPRGHTRYPCWWQASTAVRPCVHTGHIVCTQGLTCQYHMRCKLLQVFVCMALPPTHQR
jgi:hypothetical protein